MNIQARTALILAGAAALAGCETVAQVVGDEYTANLSGAAEVPGPGDADGWGRATVDLNPTIPQVCTDLEVRDILVPATAAHTCGPVYRLARTVANAMVPAQSHMISTARRWECPISSSRWWRCCLSGAKGDRPARVSSLRRAPVAAAPVENIR